MSIRSMVYQGLLDSLDFQGLFANEAEAIASLYPAAPDTPTQQRWVALVWGLEDPPLGRDSNARTKALTVWAYDRNDRYDWIDRSLATTTRILVGMEGAKDADSSLIGITPSGRSEDLYDDAYQARTRNVLLRVAVKD